MNPKQHWLLFMKIDDLQGLAVGWLTCFQCQLSFHRIRFFVNLWLAEQCEGSYYASRFFSTPVIQAVRETESHDCPISGQSESSAVTWAVRAQSQLWSQQTWKTKNSGLEDEGTNVVHIMQSVLTLPAQFLVMPYRAKTILQVSLFGDLVFTDTIF